MRSINIFYGWWIIGAVFLIAAYVGGVIVFGFTAVFEPIVEEFDWSYTQISVAASIRGLESSFLAPVVGYLLDRFGLRKVIGSGIIVGGLGLLLLSRVNSIAFFYSTFVLMAVCVSTCTGPVPMVAAANWFRKRLTLAIGIAASGVALGGLLVPLVTRIIDTLGWRTAMVIFAIGIWAILLPLSLLVRHKPEQYGYLPYGVEKRGEPLAGGGLAPVQTDETDIGVKQAMRSRPFWHLTLGLTFHMFVINAVIVHIMPYLGTIGVNRTIASIAASAVAVMSVLGRVGSGWFGDKYDRKKLIVFSYALLGVSILLFGFVGAVGTWLLVPLLILFGIGFGGPVPLMPAMLRDYYGRAHLGTILGLVSGIASLGMASGAPVAGWIYDTLGNYQTAWFAFTFVVIAGMVSIMTIPSVGNALLTANDSKGYFEEYRQ